MRRLRWLPHCLLGLLWLISPATYGADCSADHIDAVANVRYVHDGDTIALADGRKVRLIGIDTPELARDGQAAEPLAIAARDFLRGLLDRQARVQLRYDEQRLDRYGRTLAHLFLSNGNNVEQLLLQAGLASTLIMPPNQWAADCYHAAQRRARRQQTGIWRLPSMQPQALATLPAQKTAGILILHGTVHDISNDPHISRIHLRDDGHDVYLHIKPAELPLFKKQLHRLHAGDRVEVQGWLTVSDDYRFMRLRDPGALQLLTR